MINWPKIRTWGWYATFIRTPWFCIKLLKFKPSKSLSMQRHKHRTELWLFIKGKGFIMAPRPKWKKPFDTWKINNNEWHQFNAGKKPVYVIELQYGKKVTEEDIERV